ncbi:MAG: bifunctional biotin--[acetyl-CoA-carboxylase] ligase/biotin operon repressor BirA [Halieaceae bacterium]|jgi:BirA family transcriptional regulator, biotin operon repressor / biotin---[acetyl-CoA-carboxylase] ligase|nr:bifunctional biotin--[acetyl-CoA-carboxylase] ligase/biotin operon repressor BirA [Halieaceae bacterium]
MAKTVLLPLLADGNFHSGQDLAKAIGVSRTAVWKQLAALEQLGVEVESVKGRGYRIPGGLDLLQELAVRGNLNQRANTLIGEFALHEVIDSTNAEIMRRLELGEAGGLVCTAEQQTAGRGRRGRQWVSPYGRNLYVSLAWEFTQGAAALEGLSLAVGVAVAQALASCGLPGVQLKWPNDVLYGGAKLGGILLEMVGDAAGVCHVVVGVGLNVNMPSGSAGEIDQIWTDVSTMAGADCPGRNVLLAALLNELLPLVADYETTGFSVWREHWQSRDAYYGQSVILSAGSNVQAGVAQGVDERGALLLDTAAGRQVIYGGEVSLRRTE